VIAGPFMDGYLDGLRDTDHWSHLYPHGRAHRKYLDGMACGRTDRDAGALEPVEQVSP
jgi:hypothetical protein